MAELEIMAPRCTDEEASSILDELSRLQAWCVMQMRHDRGATAAADLVQRTRILIIERCKKSGGSSFAMTEHRDER